MTSGGLAVPVLLDEAFAGDILGYTVAVPHNVVSIAVVPTAAQPHKLSHLVVNGQPTANGTKSQAISIAQGATASIGVSLTAQDYRDHATYNLTAYREKDSERLLHRLEVGDLELGVPYFDPRTTTFSTAAEHRRDHVRVTATGVDADSRITVDGKAVDGSGSCTVDLAEGNNQVTVSAASPDGTSSTSYSIDIHRHSSDELASLTADHGVIVRDFDPDVRTVAFDVPSHRSTIRLTPTAFAADDATILVGGEKVASGAQSSPLKLDEGFNDIAVTVNGKTTYTVSVYRVTQSRGLDVTQDDDQMTIRDASLSVTFDKHDARIVQMHKPLQKDIIGAGMGYFFLNPSYTDSNGGQHNYAFSPTPDVTKFHVASQSDDAIDIYYTFDDAPITSVGPFLWELHFAFTGAESGFYSYVTATRPKQKTTPGQTWSVGQVRWSIRADADQFRYVQNEGTSAVELPRPDQVTARYEIMNATYRMPDSSGYTKYDMVHSEAFQRFYGLLGERYGLWFISVGNDYTDGLPTAKEIGAHQTDTTPIVNWAPSAGHYGRDDGEPEPGWSHIWGPIKIYLNESSSMRALYRDVEEKTRIEERRWPYRWLSNPLYQGTERSTVRGKLTVKGSAQVKDAMVILAAPDKDWQLQGGGYVYYARADRSGHFVIDHVRPGDYTLYAYTAGAFGEYRHDGIHVGTRATVNTGNLVWDARESGQTLWQIGKPDRTPSEFRHGDDDKKWGLWLTYPFEFPNGVDYRIGSSSPRQDWNYAQPLNKTPGALSNLLAPFSNDPADWKIRFDARPNRHYKKGLLTVAIASERSAAVAFTLNGTVIKNYVATHSDSAFPRSEDTGIYKLLEIPFDASLLREGENELSITPTQHLFNGNGVRVTDTYSAILYDSLRMSVSRG